MHDINYTVIVPHYNSANALNQLLNSIPRRADVQTIVIDDGSTDASFETARSSENFAHVTFIKAGKKTYAGGARNIGLGRANGKYIIFADADDMFSRNAFDTFDRYIDRDADIVILGTISYVNGGIEVGSRDKYRRMRLIKGGISAALGAVPPWAKMMKKSFIDDHGLYFSEVIAANDVVFSVKAACLTRSIVTDQTIVYEVTHSETSLSTINDEEKVLSRLAEQRKRIKLIKKYKPVSIFLYCLFHSRLFYFERSSKALLSNRLDSELTEYKKELGTPICVFTRIISLIPMNQRAIECFSLGLYALRQINSHVKARL
jgi:glycosyltransferase involved in cell wall biosynthesis